MMFSAADATPTGGEDDGDLFGRDEGVRETEREEEEEVREEERGREEEKEREEERKVEEGEYTYTMLSKWPIILVLCTGG